MRPRQVMAIAAMVMGGGHYPFLPGPDHWERRQRRASDLARRAPTAVPKAEAKRRRKAAKRLAGAP